MSYRCVLRYQLLGRNHFCTLKCIFVPKVSSTLFHFPLQKADWAFDFMTRDFCLILCRSGSRRSTFWFFFQILRVGTTDYNTDRTLDVVYSRFRDLSFRSPKEFEQALSLSCNPMRHAHNSFLFWLRVIVNKKNVKA